MTLIELAKSLTYTRSEDRLPEGGILAFIARIKPGETGNDVEYSVALYDPDAKKFARLTAASWDQDEEIPEHISLCLNPKIPLVKADAWADLSAEWGIKNAELIAEREA